MTQIGCQQFTNAHSNASPPLTFAWMAFIRQISNIVKPVSLNICMLFFFKIPLSTFLIIEFHIYKMNLWSSIFNFLYDLILNDTSGRDGFNVQTQPQKILLKKKTKKFHFSSHKYQTDCISFIFVGPGQSLASFKQNRHSS